MKKEIKIELMSVGEVFDLIKLSKKFNAISTKSVFSSLQKDKVLCLEVKVDITKENALEIKKFAIEKLNIPIVIKPIKHGIEICKIKN